MARIKLQVPDKIIFETVINVRITDINYGNHLGNDALVSILHEARMQWLSTLNFTELNFAGTSLIMSDLAIEYKNEGFYKDELTIKIAIGETSSVGFEIYYHLFNQHNIEIAKAKTGMVCFNYQNKKLATLPSVFKTILQRNDAADF